METIAANAARPRRLTRTFLAVWVSSFAAFVALAAQLPVLPRYADGPLGAGSVGVGLAVGASSITALLFQPLAGRIADRRGRRLILLAGTGLAATMIAAYTLTGGLASLVALRLVVGSKGYELIERDGAPPETGEHVELEDGVVQLVAKVGRSPLPGDRRPCAYLEPVPPPAPDE